jgi:hypothetical protein
MKTSLIHKTYIMGEATLKADFRTGFGSFEFEDDRRFSGNVEELKRCMKRREQEIDSIAFLIDVLENGPELEPRPVNNLGRAIACGITGALTTTAIILLDASLLPMIPLWVIAVPVVVFGGIGAYYTIKAIQERRRENIKGGNA